MNYTHMKRPYRAQCIQLTLTNTEEVVSFLKQNGAEGHIYGQYLMVRFPNGGINTIGDSSWVVVGENGKVKVYNDEVFHIKYEQIHHG